MTPENHPLRSRGYFLKKKLQMSLKTRNILSASLTTITGAGRVSERTTVHAAGGTRLRALVLNHRASFTNFYNDGCFAYLLVIEQTDSLYFQKN
jgi:hypothetical protein